MQMTPALQPPTAEEYAPFHAEYVQRAQQKNDVRTLLSQQIDNLRSALGHLTDTQARFRFGPKEWSVKEVVGHLNDVERVFSYRLLRISRNDQTPLPGFDQEDYVREASFDDYKLDDLIQEFEDLRRANILMIANMKDAAIQRRGTAGDATVSARALIYMLAGHVEHHMESLRTNYFPAT